MNTLILALALVLCAACTSAEPDFTSEHVVIGTPDNFDGAVANAHALVLLYAPWCGHCKSIKPAWNRVADLFAGEDDVKIVAVDADKHRSLGERFGVPSFPTLKYLPKGGAPAEGYEGGRSEAALLQFMNERAGTDVMADGSGGGKTKGVMPELGQALRGFKEASAEEMEAKLKEAKALAGLSGEASESMFEVYWKIGRKIIDQGVGYVGKEKVRLAAMLSKSKSSLSKEQRNKFQERINVLTNFDEL